MAAGAGGDGGATRHCFCASAAKPQAPSGPVSAARRSNTVQKWDVGRGGGAGSAGVSSSECEALVAGEDEAEAEGEGEGEGETDGETEGSRGSRRSSRRCTRVTRTPPQREPSQRSQSPEEWRRRRSTRLKAENLKNFCFSFDMICSGAAGGALPSERSSSDAARRGWRGLRPRGVPPIADLPGERAVSVHVRDEIHGFNSKQRIIQFHLKRLSFGMMVCTS